MRATPVDGTCNGYATTCLTVAASASSEEVTKDNIRDLPEMGVSCVTVDDFTKAH